MTMTTPIQTDELRIVGGPTIADAQLIVAMQQVDAINGTAEGWQLLQAFDAPPTLGQLRKRHPVGSLEHRRIGAFLGACETMCTFVKQGVLHEGLVNDVYWLSGAWKQAEKVCKGLRKETGDGRIMENFELIALRNP